MAKKRESWPVRANHTHFTDAEKNLIAKAFRDGVRSTIIAEQLGCTIRVINDHFGRLSGQSGYSRAPRRRDLIPPARRPAPNRSSRHYHSDFEPA